MCHSSLLNYFKFIDWHKRIHKKNWDKDETIIFIHSTLVILRQELLLRNIGLADNHLKIYEPVISIHPSYLRKIEDEKRKLHLIIRTSRGILGKLMECIHKKLGLLRNGKSNTRRGPLPCLPPFHFH